MHREIFIDGGLFVGIVAIVIAFYFFGSSSFIWENSLMEQSGETGDLNTYYVESSARYNVPYIKFKMEFTLNSTEKRYRLSMIQFGRSRYHERFETLKGKIRDSEKVSVWIKKNQKNWEKPIVFKITTRNGEILYGFEESNSNTRMGFLISLGVGFLGIVYYLRSLYWKKAKRL
ncbi:hypothetical protein [Spongiimicrobium salis]|uniref:hypothetical protein n=1 Tax=Spongiimicrobium salis TaxID=1667022 RepID=UPI00374D31A7